MSGAVLIVDDSSTARMQAGRTMTEAGYRIIPAVDGLDALEKLDANSDIVLIICDVNMPRMSGIEFVETLAHRPNSSPPVLMLTNEAAPHLVERAKASGVTVWMLKPFTSELLAAAARKLIGS